MSASDGLPLVYSCSGASSAAQMANHIAVRLDRLQVAEMSCIAGVGGDVKPLVRTAKSGRPIVALDGCPLHCAAHILKRHGLTPDKHYDLSNLNVEKGSIRTSIRRKRCGCWRRSGMTSPRSKISRASLPARSVT